MAALYALLWMPKLSPSARRVAAWLVWHANGYTGRCDPGQTRLIAETKLSERSVRNAVKELEEAGVIKRELRGTRSTQYWIMWGNLSDSFSALEESAQGFQHRGRNLPLPGAETCRSEGQEPAPKPIEVTHGTELMFRVGIILANANMSEEEVDRHNAKFLLGIKEDDAFLQVLSRAEKDGLRMSEDWADLVMDRVEAITDNYDFRYEVHLGISKRLEYANIYRERHEA